MLVSGHGIYRLSGLPPKGQLFNAAADAKMLGDLRAGHRWPMVVPDALCYEVYLRGLRRRIEAGGELPLVVDSGRMGSAVREGFAPESSREFKTYLQSRRQLQDGLADLEGYAFSWGFLIEGRHAVEGAIWEFLPGEILRHSHHHGRMLDDLKDTWDEWVTGRKIPRRATFGEAWLGMGLLRSNDDPSSMAAMRQWLARTFIPDQLPHFLSYACERAFATRAANASDYVA